ncbi:hypothetical protein [Pontiella sp.]|uniref:hypothetical protein n=1 Tax=Pontiella sp. TaxID=2837462 RepID=UPI00356A8A12
MIACKQVAKALANHRYYELPWWRRIPMFIHIRLCVMCGKYHRQVVDMQKGVHDYLQHEEAGEVEAHLHLSEAAKKRIEQALEQKQ